MSPWSLRQSIVQLWCCARTSAGAATGSVALAGANRDRRKLAGIFGREQQVPICIEYEASGPEADEFDRIFASKNLEALAGLLDYEAPIVHLIEPKHPWAEDPQSIGALAAVFIALLASVASNGDPEFKAELLSAGGAAASLVAYLSDENADRVQAAVVALSYLTDECPVNAQAVFQAGALPPLVRQLDSPVAGLRGAAASTLRHICIENEVYCEAFVSLGGMRGFVNLLDPVGVSQFDPNRSMLEAVWNLEDVTTGPDGRVVERWAKIAVENGALEKLEKLKSVGEDDEVCGAAEKVWMVLAQIQVNEHGR